MSLFGTLLSPIAFAPRGLMWMFEKVQEEGDRELNDPVRLRGELMTLQRHAAAGALTDAQYEEQEARILARLDGIELRQDANRAAPIESARPATRRRGRIGHRGNRVRRGRS